MNTYVLNSQIVDICEIFSKRVAFTNLKEYERRGQFDISKIQNDIFYGKLAEWGVYFIYVERGNWIKLSTPDMNVYQSTDKTFDPDLRFDIFNLHIKSQTYESAERYGDSWMFQTRDPLLNNANKYDIMIGCRVNLDLISREALVEIKLEKPFLELKISDPKLAKFKNGKKAIYLKENNE